MLSANIFAQIQFEKGYYVSNNNQKIAGLIKNIDWKSNPDEFEFKKDTESEAEIISIKSAKEFGLSGIKYVRFTVNIDRSTDDIARLKKGSAPVFKKETLFLKEIVSGKACLYQYVDSNTKRFFYTTEKMNITPLIYKRYLNHNRDMLTNNTYKQQLTTSLISNRISKTDVKKLKYNIDKLSSLFYKYNNQAHPGKEKEQKKSGNISESWFHLNIRPGIDHSSLSISHGTDNADNIDLDSEISFRIGAEAEFVLPFNKNKWSVIVEPVYQSYKTEKPFKNQSVNVDYKSIELSVGARYKMFLTKKSALSLSLSLLKDWDLDSEIKYELYTPYDITTRVNFGLGIGYVYNNKYSLEVKYHTNREVLSDYIFKNTDYKKLSFVIGYRLF
jgi:hypothetical protein